MILSNKIGRNLIINGYGLDKLLKVFSATPFVTKLLKSAVDSLFYHINKGVYLYYKCIA